MSSHTPNPENQVLEPCGVCRFHWNMIVMPGDKHHRNCPHFDDTEKGCACQRCGQRYKVDVMVPDDLWSRIRPEDKAEGAGLLCGRCIFSRIEALGQFDNFTLTSEYARVRAGGEGAELRRNPRVNLLLVALRKVRDSVPTLEAAQALATIAIEEYVESDTTTPPAATAGDVLPITACNGMPCTLSGHHHAPTPSSPARAAAEVDDAMAVCRLLTTLDWTVGYELTGENQIILDRAQQLALKVMGMTDPTPDDKGGR